MTWEKESRPRKAEMLPLELRKKSGEIVMKKIMIVLFVLLFSASAFAQLRTGNIYGEVVDENGDPLPGVTITLTGTLTSTVTYLSSQEGRFRFLSLAPASDYSLKAEVQGFKTKIENGVIVTIGTNSNITLTMEMGSLEEEVTVVAVNPIVDLKTTQVGQNIGTEALQGLPSARDPWVMLQMAPAIMIDRENVGGSESGSQSGFVAHGSTTANQNVWSVDGAVITDVSSTWSSIYYDFDSFEEMNITVGGNDISVQTGGISVNMVTKRGGNRVSLAGRFYLTDGKFQSQEVDQSLIDAGLRGINHIVEIRDYGFNLGGPLVNDKAWFWLAWGTQDIKTMNLYQNRDDTFLTQWNGKLNLQLIPENRLEIFGIMAQKKKYGRSSSYSNPQGYNQGPPFYFGDPVLKIQDEHMFGQNLFLSGKFVYVDSGFTSTPASNLDMDKMSIWNEGESHWISGLGYNTQSGDHRRRFDYSLDANYFNDYLFGAAHVMKAGIQYSNRPYDSAGETDIFYDENYNYPTFDITGDGVADYVDEIMGDPNNGYDYYLMRLENARRSFTSYGMTGYSLYFQDVITAGKFNVSLGLRYDYQHPRVKDYEVGTSVKPDDKPFSDVMGPGTAAAISNIFPATTIPANDPDWAYKTWSPRIGFSWDITGNGTTVAKLSAAQYGDFMTTGTAGYFRALGTSGEMDFWWMDDNQNGITDVTELYWHNSQTFAPYQVFDSSGNFLGDYADAEGIMWSGYDFLNPTQTTRSEDYLDPDFGSTRVTEAIMSLEKELATDLGVAAYFTFRRYDRAQWTSLDYYPDTGHYRTKDDYVQVGTVPSQVGPYSTGSAVGRPYYLLDAGWESTPYDYVMNRPDFKQDFYGLDLVMNKRLSNKWMMNASASFASQKVNHGENGYLDPTNLWATDNRPYSAYMGGISGTISQYTFARWMVKASGLYQFPWDLNLSATFKAREGNIIRNYFTITDYGSPNPKDRSVDVYVEPFGDERLPSYFTFDLRLEKIVRVGDYGRIYLMADLFNALNRDTITRRYQRYLGTWYAQTDTFVERADNYLINQILNPRVLRLGARFQF